MSKSICRVCPHACQLELGEIGRCNARQAQANGVVPLYYACSSALALDPIEKKPLARFYPGKSILSYGSFGCNLACDFCQNWRIAQISSEPESVDGFLRSSHYLSATALVEQAKELVRRGNIGIALTYNEPLICPEYILDVAELARPEGLKLVLVTNGYCTPDIAEKVFAQVDAANIDLKAFRQEFYSQVGAPAGLATVKRTIEIALAQGCHVEVTTLVVPGLNDSPTEMQQEVEWLASISQDTPLHLSRFHPAYNMMDRAPTPHRKMYELEAIAREHLEHVFLGNM